MAKVTKKVDLVFGGVYKDGKGSDIVITYLDGGIASYLLEDGKVQVNADCTPAELQNVLNGFKLTDNIFAF